MKTVQLLPIFTAKTFRTSSSLRAHELSLFLNVLKYFGHYIAKLRVNFEDLREEECYRIIEYIDHYTSNTLKELHMDRFKKNHLENIQHPFKNIEVVSFEGKFNKFGSATLDLNELFPNLRALSLENIQVVNKCSIDLEFPHLKYLSIIFGSPKGLTETDIKPMLINNPQIRNLTTGRTSMRFLQFISQNLANIEALDLPHLSWDYYNDGVELIFQSVKKLSVKVKNDQTPDLLEFSQLTELELNCFPDFSMQCVDYILKYQNLVKLDIVGSTLENGHLSGLNGRLPNLISASVNIWSDVQAETIINFVKSREQLQILRLVSSPSPQFSTEKQQAIIQQLSENWTFRNFRHGHIIERKNQL